MRQLMTGLSQSTDIRERPQDLLAAQARNLARGLFPPMPKPEVPLPPPILPALIGEKAIKPDGQIDWERMPRRPKNFPVNAEFKVMVVKGLWHVEINENK